MVSFTAPALVYGPKYFALSFFIRLAIITRGKGSFTVTFINGVLNLIRLLIENNQLNGIDSYRDKLKSIDGFNIKQYKSSQYRRMGEDIYNKYFTTK